MNRLAVFGGSFDPPHVGHLLGVTYVLATQPVDEVLIVPAFEHPFGKAMAPYDHRLAMCQHTFADLRRVTVSEVERSLARPSRTLHMLQALAVQRPGASFRLVVGTDILRETHKWYAWDAITALAPPIVLGRVGHPHANALPFVLPELASRDVRASVAAGRDVAALVASSVDEYIRSAGLYRETPDATTAAS